MYGNMWTHSKTSLPNNAQKLERVECTCEMDRATVRKGATSNKSNCIIKNMQCVMVKKRQETIFSGCWKSTGNRLRSPRGSTFWMVKIRPIS